MSAAGETGEILIVECPQCSEPSYYLVSLAEGATPALETICSHCGYREVGVSGRLKWVEALLHEQVCLVREVLESRGLSARIELKVTLRSDGTSVRVRDTSQCEDIPPVPDPLAD